MCLIFVCMHKAAVVTAILSDIGQFKALREGPLWCMAMDQSRTLNPCSTCIREGRGWNATDRTYRRSSDFSGKQELSRTRRITSGLRVNPKPEGSEARNLVTNFFVTLVRHRKRGVDCPQEIPYTSTHPIFVGAMSPSHVAAACIDAGLWR